MLTRKYGTNLCYTPMLHSKMLMNKKYREEHFTSCKEDRPLVAQLCGNDP
jgi:tRNA-dihydrouridine synthase 1